MEEVLKKQKKRLPKRKTTTKRRYIKRKTTTKRRRITRSKYNKKQYKENRVYTYTHIHTTDE